MAPTTQLLRISELEAKSDRADIKLATFNRELELTWERMDALKQDMAMVKVALFGDPSDAKNKPGVIAEMGRMELKQDQSNEILTRIQRDLRWLNLTVLGAVVLAVLKLVLSNTPNP